MDEQIEYTPRRQRGRPKAAIMFATNNDFVRPLGTEFSSGYVRCKLREVAVQQRCVIMQGAHRGEANISAIVRGTGLSHNTVVALANNDVNLVGIKMSTIAKLCAFFQCEVSDLFEYVQWEGRRAPPSVPEPRAIIKEDMEFDGMVQAPLETKGVSEW